MIYGTVKWDDSSIRYDQTKRVIEKFLADLKESKQVNFWLETCNVNSCCCAIESVNGGFRVKLPYLASKPIITYADLLFDYIYNSDMYKKDGVCENEVMENLVKGINAISDCTAEIITSRTNKDCCKKMIDVLKNKCAIVLSYDTDYESGHYICIVAYDDSKKCFIGYDSWSNNKHCKNKGIKEEYSVSFIEKRIRHKKFIKVKGDN